MLVLIPIIIVAGLFIVASFAPFLWRRSLWGPRPRMMYRPLVRYHRPFHHHHRHW